MPPLPNTFDEDTQATIQSLQRHETDLSDFQIPRLRKCTGPLALQQQHAAEVREDLDNYSRSVEQLEIAVEDQLSKRDRAALRELVEEYKRTLAKLRQDTRNALLTSKRAIDAQSALSTREELLRTTALREKPEPNEKITEDALMKTSADVTEALGRTIGLMQKELETSVLSIQLLEDSTASLRSTSTVYDTMDNLMGASKQLIVALEKSDWLDRLVVFAALGFFLLVVGFILTQRIVHRSFRLAFWWTRFLPDFSARDGNLAPALEKMERGEISPSMTSVLTTLATTTSIMTATLSTPSPPPLESVSNHTEEISDAGHATVDSSLLPSTSLLETIIPSATVPLDDSPSSSSDTGPRDEL